MCHGIVTWYQAPEYVAHFEKLRKQSMESGSGNDDIKEACKNQRGILRRTPGSKFVSRYSWDLISSESKPRRRCGV